MRQLLTYVLWPALAGAAFAIALLLAPKLLPAPETGTTTPVPSPVPTGPLTSYSNAIKKAAPAVVSIHSNNSIQRPVLRRLSPQSQFLVARTEDENVTSLGSGVIIDSAGYVVTSYHVFFGDGPARTIQQDIKVTLTDKRQFPGTLVALDEENDLAILKIEGEQLPSLSQIDNSTIEVGDVVLAIGNPRNIGQSVSLGIISAMWEHGESFVIQTDAAINPGNSGGALIDADGNLLGINSTIVSESGGSEGISFAIPASQAVALLQDYLSTSPSGYLGVNTNVIARADGLKAFGTVIQGFGVNAVTPGGPAEKAGLRPGDVITGVDDEQIVIDDPTNREQADRAMELIANKPAGSLIVLQVYRPSEDRKTGEHLQLPTILGVGRPNYSGIERIADSLDEQPAPPAAQ